MTPNNTQFKDVVRRMAVFRLNQQKGPDNCTLCCWVCCWMCVCSCVSPTNVNVRCLCWCLCAGVVVRCVCVCMCVCVRLSVLFVRGSCG